MTEDSYWEDARRVLTKGAGWFPDDKNVWELRVKAAANMEEEEGLYRDMVKQFPQEAKYLVELGAICEHGPDIFRHPPFDVDQSAERVGKQVGNGLAQGVELDRVGLQPLAPGKSQQLADELAPLLGGAPGHRHHPLLLLGQG